MLDANVQTFGKPPSHRNPCKLANTSYIIMNGGPDGHYGETACGGTPPPHTHMRGCLMFDWGIN